MLATTLLEGATSGAFVLLLLAVLGAFARVVRGPSLADRVIALDLLSVTLVAFAAVYAVRTGEVLSAVFLLAGAAFVAIAALGLVRLQDLYLRMHSVAKAGTLGCGLILTGVAIARPELGVILRVLGAILFLVVTAPVAAQLIGRAAHRAGVPQWKGTILDEWTEETPADDPGT